MTDTGAAIAPASAIANPTGWRDGVISPKGPTPF